MALIQITADLSRVAKALERIAIVLERLSPPPSEEPIEPSTEEDITQIVDNSYTEEWSNYAPRRNY